MYVLHNQTPKSQKRTFQKSSL